MGKQKREKRIINKRRIGNAFDSEHLGRRDKNSEPRTVGRAKYLTYISRNNFSFFTFN